MRNISPCFDIYFIIREAVLSKMVRHWHQHQQSWQPPQPPISLIAHQPPGGDTWSKSWGPVEPQHTSWNMVQSLAHTGRRWFTDVFMFLLRKYYMNHGETNSPGKENSSLRLHVWIDQVWFHWLWDTVLHIVGPLLTNISWTNHCLFSPRLQIDAHAKYMGNIQVT